ncbi:MAG: hypothetical protein ACOYLQ_15715 [Hyphomicrobiaceae bacterium]
MVQDIYRSEQGIVYFHQGHICRITRDGLEAFAGAETAVALLAELFDDNAERIGSLTDALLASGRRNVVIDQAAVAAEARPH